MSSGHRHLRGPFCRLLTDNLREIHVRPVRFLAGGCPGILGAVPYQKVFPVFFFLQDRQHLFQVVHSVDACLPVLHRFQCRLGRKDAAFQSEVHRHLGIRQSTRHGADRPVQAQLPHDQIFIQPAKVSLPGCRNDAQRNGQIVSAAVFMQIRRCQVNHYLLSRNMEIHGLQSRHRAEQAFLYGYIRKPHQVNSYTPVDFYLYKHGNGIDPYAFRSNNVYQHNPIICIFAADAASNCNP